MNALFSIPDLISGWRQASLVQRMAMVIGAGGASWFAGFNIAAGKAWAAGASGFVGLGLGMELGAYCLIAVLITLGFPIAFPRAVLDDLAKIEVDKGKEK